MPLSNPPDSAFSGVDQLWDLPRLYADLATIKQRKLTSTEQICLQGLLWGAAPSRIAEVLHRQHQGLRVDLSRGLYRYIASLTQQSVKNWRDVAVLLERSGYRLARNADQVGRSAQPELDIEPDPEPNIEPGWLSELGSLESNQRSRLEGNQRFQLTPVQNLPIQDFTTLIGREQEFQQLLEMLSYSHPVHCISVEGMGGMGKTTLVLAVANYYLKPSERSQIEPAFDAYIFASAKQQRLTSHGILNRLNPDRTLPDLFQTIARTFRQPDLLLADRSEQLERIQDLLSRQRTLLIVDNLETVEDYSNVLAFLYDLPSTVKCVITSRQQTSFPSLRLEPLSEPEGIQLIQHQAQTKQVLLSRTEAQTLYNCTNGIPAAIVYAVGQLAAGYPLKNVPDRLVTSQGDYVRFYFESTVVMLRESVSHQLFMALALFAQSAAEEAVAYVADSPELNATLDGLAHLQQLSLVEQHQERYQMLSLTKELAQGELLAYPAFEQAARERWVEWYLHFAQLHGGKDWKEWHDYSLLEQEWENLHDAIEWCIAENRYEAVRQFWWSVRCYTHAQGYRGNRLSYWDTRLDWADWLIQEAETHQDWITVLEVMLDRGWTLTLLGQPKQLKQAHAVYAKIWTLRHHSDPNFQVNLTIHMAVLQIERQQLASAKRWLDRARNLLNTIDIEETTLQRQRLQVHYYEGKIAYKMKLYDRAKHSFQQVLQPAEALRWQRAFFLAKNWLADIAIQQGELDKAQQLLNEGLQVAEANQDECRAAFCKRSLARLEEARENWTIAHHWATAAKESFERLGMIPDVRETEEVLARIERQQAAEEG
jgi:hypothetical protein